MEKIRLDDELALSEYIDKFQRNKSYYILKRVIDVTGSLTGILLLSPLMLITIVAIKVESRGPIFFYQNRVGKQGKMFKMYKFRSMVTNAEEVLKELKNEN